MESSLLVILRRHSLGLEWQQQSLKVTKEIIQKPFIRQFSWRFLGSFSTLAMRC